MIPSQASQSFDCSSSLRPIRHKCLLHSHSASIMHRLPYHMRKSESVSPAVAATEPNLGRVNVFPRPVKSTTANQSTSIRQPLKNTSLEDGPDPCSCRYQSRSRRYCWATALHTAHEPNLRGLIDPRSFLLCNDSAS